MIIEQLIKLKDNKSIVFELQTLLQRLVKEAFGLEVDIHDIEVNPTNDEKFGDFTTNIALKISKELGKNPREIAAGLQKGLETTKLDSIEKVEVAGPGFLNFYIKSDFYFNNLAKVLEEKENYGKWNIGDGQVMVEFGQPNTHKAMTAGHIKSGIMGLSSSRVIRNLGFEVIQANYYSDIGLNSAKTTWAFLKLGQPDGFDTWTISEKMQFVANCYVHGNKESKNDPAILEEIKLLNKSIFEETAEPEVYKTYLKLKEISIEQQDLVFSRLGIVFDRQYPESEVVDAGKKLVLENIDKVFIEDAGAIIFPGEKHGLNRWVFLNSFGLPTYSGKDLGLAYKKFEEFPNLVFNLTMTSTEQNNYFAAIIKALELIDKKFEGKYLFRGFGWMLRDGKKMNSKSGTAIGVDDLFNDAYEFAEKNISEAKNYSKEEIKTIAEKVVMAGLKFLMLSREFHIDINYEPKQFLNPEGFSGPYVLYAYVRATSILKECINALMHQCIPGEYEINEDELRLLKLLYNYQLTTLNAGRNMAPHLICNYIFELAQAFNKFYKNNKVLIEDEKVKSFRLALTSAVATILRNGLDLLGIETVEKM
jgi:arginyl-tRNA synthetase